MKHFYLLLLLCCSIGCPASKEGSTPGPSSHQKDEPTQVSKEGSTAAESTKKSSEPVGDEDSGLREDEIVFECIGAVSRNSGLSAEVGLLLAEHRIEYIIAGSRGLSISVEPSRADEARRILLKWRNDNEKEVFVYDGEVELKPDAYK